MAIIKQAKNLKIKVWNNDVVMAGKHSQTAEEIIIESLDGNISLSSAKKICSTGNQE